MVKELTTHCHRDSHFYSLNTLSLQVLLTTCEEFRSLHLGHGISSCKNSTTQSQQCVCKNCNVLLCVHLLWVWIVMQWRIYIFWQGWLEKLPLLFFNFQLPMDHLQVRPEAHTDLLQLFPIWLCSPRHQALTDVQQLDSRPHFIPWSLLKVHLWMRYKPVRQYITQNTMLATISKTVSHLEVKIHHRQQERALTKTLLVNLLDWNKRHWQEPIEPLPAAIQWSMQYETYYFVYK